MVKIIASIGALLFSGSLAALSLGEQAQHEPARASEHIDAIASVAVDVRQVPVTLAAAGSAGRRSIGEMSDEEKERRREVCAKEFEVCHDWCMASNRRAYNQRMCVENKCVPKLADCMKEIPN